MLTCAESLLKLLVAYGFDTVFGIPGAHTVPLYRDFGSYPLTHVTPRHEEGAGFMADGYARAGGQPAACFVIAGPGVTNIATAMGQAFEESSPMLVVSTVNRTHALGMGRGCLHELHNQHDLTAPVTAFSHTVLDPSQLSEVMARAMAVFRSERPRPVHIQIPLDVVERISDAEPEVWATPNKPAPTHAIVSEAHHHLADALRPVLIIGGGAADAGPEVRRLAETLDAPVICTINGKGVVTPDHPLFVGTALPYESTRELVRCADVVVAIGTELQLIELYPFPGRLEIPGRLLRIDIDPWQLTRKYRPDVAIHSDAAAACDALATALRGATRSASGDGTGAARAAAAREGFRRETWPLCTAARRIMTVVRAAVPDAIIVGDSTQLIYDADHHVEMARPRSYMTSTTGYGTLGFGLPAAIGAKLAAPKRGVVCITGDGGLQFTIQEMATAAELHLPLAVLVWNNEGLAEIQMEFDAAGIPRVGVDACPPDFVAIARGMGCEAQRAADVEHLGSLVAEAAGLDRPMVIDVRARDFV